MPETKAIEHPLLSRCGVAHGFCAPSEPDPLGVLRPRQVHGRAVARVSRAETDRLVLEKGAGLDREEADAIVCDSATADEIGRPVGVVTADCVPILACTQDGRAVAAIHAGWRGLAAGVVEAGIATLREQRGVEHGAAKGEISAVIGPHIGSCCYEVDDAVIDPLRARFGGAALARATSVTRAGHARLALLDLALADLHRAGVERESCGVIEVCTFCAPQRLESYRRDGEQAGRMLHFIRPARSAKSAAPKPTAPKPAATMPTAPRAPAGDGSTRR